CRVGFHFTMDDAEADFVVEAVAFLAMHGPRFLSCYRFDLGSGAWTHRDTLDGRFVPPPPAFPLAAARSATAWASARPVAKRRAAYRAALAEARALAEALPPCERGVRLDGELGALQFFALAE